MKSTVPHSLSFSIVNARKTPLFSQRTCASLRNTSQTIVDLTVDKIFLNYDRMVVTDGFIAVSPPLPHSMLEIL